MKNIAFSQRISTVSTIILGLICVAFLGFQPVALVLATSDPLSGPITPTPSPISSPINPTVTPTPKVTVTPTAIPTPTAVPSSSPTPTPFVTGSPTPTPKVTVTPTAIPTPTAVPLPSATPTPTVRPTNTPTPTPAAMYIVDNTDRRFSTRGQWFVSTSGTGFFGSNFAYSTNQQKNPTAIWTPSLPAGKYRVYVRYTSGSDRSSKVKYTTVSANGKKFYLVNQKVNGGQWVTLGEFIVTLPFGNYVEVTSESKGIVVADAVLFEKI